MSNNRKKFNFSLNNSEAPFQPTILKGKGKSLNQNPYPINLNSNNGNNDNKNNDGINETVIEDDMFDKFEKFTDHYFLIPWQGVNDLSRRPNLSNINSPSDEFNNNHNDINVWLSNFATDDWKVLSDEEGHNYLPNQKPIKIFMGSVHSTNEFKFEKFDVKSLKHTSESPGVIFNVGGPPKSISWCPSYKNSPPLHKSYIAITTTKNQSHNISVGVHDKSRSHSSIQIWGYVPPHEDNDSIISLMATLCFDNGVCLDCKWAPTDYAFYEYGDNSRITVGALACAFNDGSLQISLFPDFELLRKFYGVEDGKNLFINLIKTLELQTPNSKPLTIEWSSSNRLAVGFSNGCIGIYDVRNSIREKRRTVRPYAYINVHQAGVRTLTWAQIPEINSQFLTHELSNEYPLIISAGYDGSIFTTDLRDSSVGNASGSVMLDHVRGYVYDIDYSMYLTAPIVSESDDIVSSVSFRKNEYRRVARFSEFKSGIWSIACSTNHPFIAVGGFNGHVEVVNPISIMVSRQKRKNTWVTHDLFGIEYSRNDDAYRMIDHFKPPQLTTLAKSGNKGVNESKYEEYGRYTATFLNQTGVFKTSWNPDIKRCGVLASATASGLIRIDELWA